MRAVPSRVRTAAGARFPAAMPLMLLLAAVLALGAMAPRAAATTARRADSPRLLARIAPRENRGALYWHGNLATGELALYADSASGGMLLGMTSRGGRPRLFGAPPPNPGEGAGATMSDSAWAAAIRTAHRQIRMLNDLNRICRRTKARGEAPAAVQDSLDAYVLLHRDFVTVAAYSSVYGSLSVTWRDIPGAESMPAGVLSPGEDAESGGHADLSHAHDFEAETIVRELRAGKIVLVGPGGALGVVPCAAGETAWFQAQVDTLRMGRAPSRPWPLMHTVRHLLVQVPLEQLER